MAKVADPEAAVRTAESAAARNYNRRVLAVKLCCVAMLLAVIVCSVTAFVMGIRWLKDNDRYRSPQFNLTSLDASQPSALVLGREVVAAGWVACFSTRNPNANPVSYARAHAVVWGRRAGVAPFRQPPHGGGVVCAGFPGDAMMKMETDETVWFGAVRFNAEIRYKSDVASLEVVCKGVRVLVRGNVTAVATELDGGARECRVERFSKSWIFSYLFFSASFGITALAAFAARLRMYFIYSQ